ncbi:MAG: CIA30 family protein [Nonlabens sp.]|uniref:CIA30 family protein n=1 Tax=Nonlabens sp. TaxID=1888209 RepID=UPI003219F621
MDKTILIDFSSYKELEDWTNINDTVMGGISKSTIELNSDGHAVFSGTVSLEKNGGFASARYQCPDTKLGDATKAFITLKGDGNEYQLRFKESSSDGHSYIIPFSTTGKWETVELILEDMIPSFKGSHLNMDNFDHTFIDELSIFIGNEEVDFELLIDKIELA